MRYYSILAFAALSLFSSCKLYEDGPEGANKPGVVITEELRQVQDLLASSPMGWQGVMIPGSYQYGGINFCFKFDDKFGVDVSSEDGIDPIHSGYNLTQSSGIRLTLHEE